MGKPVSKSAESYNELRAIMDAVYGGRMEISAAFKKAYELLNNYGVGLRGADGKDPVITLSPPDDNTIVLGLRYIKDDGRTTEDHFIFKRDTDLYCCKGKEIDNILPQYKGTHELQLSR